jgi:hypothetical protein
MRDVKASQETKVDALSPNAAETLAFHDQRIAATREFLNRNPDFRLAEGARSLLQEYEEKRAKFLWDVQNPAPAPPPPPTPELIKRISDEVQALLPQIIAKVVVRLQQKK